MKAIFLLIGILFSQTTLGQVVKGGIDPPKKNPEEFDQGKRKTPGGGVPLSLVLEFEKKIKSFNSHLQKRQKKCLGLSTEFKTFIEAIAYLNIQLNSGSPHGQHSDHCDDLRSYRCLMNRKSIKLLKSISESPVLEHYLVEHENLLEKDFQQLRINLKKHYGQ